MVISARDVKMVQLKINQTVRRVNRWIKEHGIQLAAAKTEIVILTKKRIPTILPMQIRKIEVQLMSFAKCLE